MNCRLFRVTVDFRDSMLSWVALLGSILLMLSSQGFTRMYGFFYSAFLAEFKSSNEKAAWVGSIPLSLVFMLSPLAVWLHERFGLRRCTALAAVPLSASLLLTSFARNVDEMFLTYSLPFGLASCLIIMGSIKAVCTYFDKRLATAHALQTAGCSIMEIGLSYIIIFLLNKVTLERTFQILAALLLCIGLFSSQLFFSTNYQSEETCQKRNSYHVSCKLLKKKPFLLYLFAMIILAFTYSVSSVHQVQLALELGMSKSLARQFPVFAAISGGVGRLVAGVVADSKIVNLISYFQFVLLFNGAISIIAAFSYSKAHLLAYIWIYSFVEGQVNILQTPITREFVGLANLSEGMSLLLSAIAIPVMLGPPLIGFLVDKTHDYKVFFYVAGIPQLLSMLVLIILRYMMPVENQLEKDIKISLCADDDEHTGAKEHNSTLLHRETSV